MARTTSKPAPVAPTIAREPRRPPAADPLPPPLAGRARRDLFEAVWSLFCSVRFAVVQILLLAGAAILGTLIPQMPIGLRDFPTDYASFLNTVQARFGTWTEGMLWAGMFDLYNSFWFRLLVLLQVYSIIVCTLNRWGPIWRQIHPSSVRSNETFLRTMQERANFLGVPLAPDPAADAISQALRRSRYRVLRERDPTDGSVYLYADRARWSKLVTFVSHAALVMLILTMAFLASYGWREQGLLFLPGRPLNVGHRTTWTVRSDKFEIEYYPGTSSIKEFWNTLSVLRGNTVAETKRIRVNDPLRYEGINYFLVSTQTVASLVGTTAAGDPLPLTLMGTPALGSPPVGNAIPPLLLTFGLQSAESLPMDMVQVVRPGKETITLQVTEYTDVARGPGEAPPLFVRAFVGQNAKTPYYNNFVPRSGELVIPELPDVRFTLRGDIAPILEVAKDPDLGWVLFWFGLMAAGFALSLYVTFSRCWVRITRRADLPQGCDVTLGGLTDRNKVSFEREFERLALRARDRLAAQVAAE